MVSAITTVLVSGALLAGFSKASPYPRAASSLASLPVSTFDFTAAKEAIAVKHARNLANYAVNAGSETHQALQKNILSAAIGLELAANDTAGPAELYDLVKDGSDVTYLLPVSFGTPAQTDRLVVDTGSGDLWTTYTKVVNSQEIGYDPSKSSTSVVTNTQFEDSYGKGDTSGTIVEDTVSAAGFTLTSRPFGVGTVADSANANTPIDGIFPMSSSALSNMGIPTYFEDLVQTGLVAQPYFSLYLGRESTTVTSDSLVQNGGQLCMGCVPTNVPTTGSLVWNPVTEFAYWTIALGGLSINGQGITGTSGLAIIDSGTTIAYVPTATAQAIASAFGGQLASDGSIIVPVNAVTDSTQFGFSFGGTTFTIAPIDLVQGYADNTRSTWVLSLMAQDITDAAGQPAALLGDIFMKNVLSVFSYSTNGGPAVGFAQISSSSSASGSITGAVATATANNITQPSFSNAKITATPFAVSGLSGVTGTNAATGGAKSAKVMGTAKGAATSGGGLTGASSSASAASASASKSAAVRIGVSMEVLVGVALATVFSAVSVVFTL